MKKRILSAIILIALFVPLLLIGGKAFAVFMSLLAIMGLYEILNIRETICKIKYSLKKIDDQARLFISDFESQLKSEDERKINLFLSNSKLNRFLCFFYGFKKNGFVRNIAYILFIL